MIVSLLIIGILFVLVITTYNRLIRLRNNAREGWSGIDVQLKRRADLVPNLVTTVKGYATHERQLLEEITNLRNQSLLGQTVPDQAKTASELGRSLKRLMFIAEAYPDLKADGNFLKLQQQLSEIEDYLQKSRRYYNGTVRELNIKIESFPSNIIARIFGFAKFDFFALSDESDRMVPEINLS
ncbi:LemA protein [Cyclobacterium lianum]|uniref:LemA protein n=1 Tax=Cyclobacterium lianum TaxID=388280 RepID=A0A1M7I4R9_9BACT|nr:LemA family protein [Cyclobacterium lianum]SHM35543.1 LemA protein [Cyclobacterium lianum]